MLFQSPLFCAFLLIVLCLLWLKPQRRVRHLTLLVASYAFYSAWDVRFLALIVLSTLVDFVAGRRIHAADTESSRKRWLLLSVVTNLGILGFFKYFDFFSASASDLAATLGLELPRTTLAIVLPVGISFYTFQSLSYTIDIYRRRLEPESSLIPFALYVAFFPQLVAGPIVRASEFLPQLRRDAAPRARDFAPGVFLFAVGLFKKIVIADHLGHVADPVFAYPELHGPGSLSFGALCYALQIYCDFSGYSDMAIGVGRLLGYRLPRNFDRPYASRSPQEFWRRWHITLGTWLRDYLYLPLGGNRKGPLRTYVNLMATMVLGGLWHGANWTFVVWGALHGVALCLHRAIRRALDQRTPGSPPARWTGWLGWPLTLSLVLVAWIPFRASSLGETKTFLAHLVTLTPGPESLDPRTLAWCAALISLALVGQSRLGPLLESWVRRLGRRPKLLLAGLLVGLAYSLSLGEDRAFLYFQF